MIHSDTIDSFDAIIDEPESRIRIWHIPQVPMQPFEYYFFKLKEAITALDILAKYDIFQYEKRVKPDYSNASGIEIYYDGEWQSFDPDDEWELEEMRKIVSNGFTTIGLK